MWTDQVSDHGGTGVDPMDRPPPPAVAPPPAGPAPARPIAIRSGRGKGLGIGALVLLVAGVGGYLLFADGGGDDDPTGDATSAADDTDEPTAGLAGALSPLIEDIGPGDDCPLLDDDTESVVADLGAVTSVSSGPGEVALDDGANATAYCNLGTGRGLVSVSATVAELDADEYLEQYYHLLQPAHDGSVVALDGVALDATETGSVAGTCLTESPQYGNQCLFVWSDGTAVLQFADVGADLEPDEGFAVLDAYVASALDRFGG